MSINKGIREFSISKCNRYDCKKNYDKFVRNNDNSINPQKNNFSLAIQQEL